MYRERSSFYDIPSFQHIGHHLLLLVKKANLLSPEPIKWSTPFGQAASLGSSLLCLSCWDCSSLTTSPSSSSPYLSWDCFLIVISPLLTPLSSGTTIPSFRWAMKLDFSPLNLFLLVITRPELFPLNILSIAGFELLATIVTKVQLSCVGGRRSD